MLELQSIWYICSNFLLLHIMFRLKLFALGLLFLLTVNQVFPSRLPDITLTDSSTVSLITCTPGEDLYSIFGHSAIRVADPQIGLDWVFNYGTFNFADPNFYLNFIRGRLNYMLSVSTYKNFEYSYIQEKRSIYEQILNLQLAEKQHLFDSLCINFLPENRYYLYDLLYDNCATRVRDVIFECFPRAVEFDYSTIEQGKSFRDNYSPYLKRIPWTKLGIDLVQGMVLDKSIEPWEYMFVPDYLMVIFPRVTIKEDDHSEPFVLETRKILDIPFTPSNRFVIQPVIVFIFIMLTAFWLTFFGNRRTLLAKWFDYILFGIVGLLGLLLTFMWFGTDHTVTVKNLNILWTMPLNLIALYLFSERGKKHQNLTNYYFGFYLTILVLVLITWPLLPQVLPLAVVPLIVTLAIRSAARTMLLNRFFYKKA